MPITNEKYAMQYNELHKQGKFVGYQTLKHKNRVLELIRDTDSSNILDYGCGSGLVYNVMGNPWGIPVTLYDPYAEEGGGVIKTLGDLEFDGVICTDVMEHIPEEDVEDVLRDMITRAKRFLFMTISTVPARKTLPNGENAHCTVKAPEWWNRQIDAVAGDKSLIIEVIYA